MNGGSIVPRRGHGTLAGLGGHGAAARAAQKAFAGLRQQRSEQGPEAPAGSREVLSTSDQKRYASYHSHCQRLRRQPFARQHARASCCTHFLICGGLVLTTAHHSSCVSSVDAPSLTLHTCATISFYIHCTPSSLPCSLPIRRCTPLHRRPASGRSRPSELAPCPGHSRLAPQALLASWAAAAPSQQPRHALPPARAARAGQPATARSTGMRPRPAGASWLAPLALAAAAPRAEGTSQRDNAVSK